MKIVLIGFRGAGKTVIGAFLAERLDLPFFDTDSLVEAREGMPVQDLFEKRGEPYFRQCEREVIQSLRGKKSAVISTGGGVILDAGNIESLRDNGVLFFLNASQNQILARIAGSHRPPLTTLPLAREVDHLLSMRRPLYRQAADFCLTTGGMTIEEVGGRILTLLSRGSIVPSDKDTLTTFVQKLSFSPEERLTCQNLLEQNPVNPTLRLCAVAGNPVSHSRSPHLFNRLFFLYRLNFYYTRLEWNEIGEIIDAFHRMDMRGLSVTIPFKEVVLPLLDEVDDHAAAIGAVNTIVQCGGTMEGFNTDWLGIREPLSPLRGCRVTILGAGGAAAAAAYACRDLEMDITILNRTPQRGARLADRFGCRWGTLSDFSPAQTDVVINATPAGMDRDTSLPVNPDGLNPTMTVFDLVYTPPETPLLREAKARGCTTISGINMFRLQAKEQFRLFTGINAPLEHIQEAMG